MKLGSVEFKCNGCKKKQSHIVWDNKDQTGIVCECGSEITLGMAVKKKKARAPGIRTPTKNRV